MIIIGFDSASKYKNIGITYSRYDKGKLLILEITRGKDIGVFLDRLKCFRNENKKILICFDTPLGWPLKLVNLISKLSANEPDIGENINYEEESEKVFKRLTDRLIKEKLGFNPLEIGADKIARTSYKTLEIISQINKEFKLKMRLAWRESDINKISMIEVYPKATLEGLNRLFNIDLNLNYRNREKNYEEDRLKIINFLKEKTDTGDINLCGMEDSRKSHELDSFICCFTGKLFVDGKLDSPEDMGIQSKEIILKEGWIWTKLNKKNK